MDCVRPHTDLNNMLLTSFFKQKSVCINVFSNSIWGLWFSGDLDFVGQAEWIHFMFLFFFPVDFYFISSPHLLLSSCNTLLL